MGKQRKSWSVEQKASDLDLMIQSKQTSQVLIRCKQKYNNYAYP